MSFLEVFGSNGDRDFHHSGSINYTIPVSSPKVAKAIAASMPSSISDFLTIVESSAFADRLVLRRRGKRWERSLKIGVPVSRNSPFFDFSTRADLIELLHFATGDSWEFEFYQSDDQSHQSAFDLDLPSLDWILPYSDGLDSAIAYEWLSEKHGGEAILRIRAGAIRSANQKQLLVAKRRFRARRILREMTYRTRPIVFFGYAAAVVATLRHGTIVVGENGQGALGPSIARFGNEWPFRSTHPGLTRRLVELIEKISDYQLKVEHPFRFMTKSEALKSISFSSAERALSKSNSCSQRPQQRYGFKMCGYCGGCLLRNLAVFCANMNPECRQAFEPRASSLEIRPLHGDATPMPRSARKVICDAVESMDAFSRFCDSENRDVILEIEANEIDPSSPTSARRALHDLAIRHRKEWYDFVDALPPSAWLRENYGAR